MDIKLMKLLLRKEKLTEIDWIEILEAVRQTVLPKLERMKLKPFSDIACVHDGTGYYGKIGSNSASCGDFFLSDHGITVFGDDREYPKAVGDIRQLSACGLTKSGQWVLIRVRTIVTSFANGKFVEEANQVSIEKADIAHILRETGLPPIIILAAINMEVADWMRRKQVLYEDAKKFSDSLQAFHDTLLHGFI